MTRTWYGLIVIAIGIAASLALAAGCGDDSDSGGSTPIPGATATSEPIDIAGLAGEWNGEWNNTTAGTSAPISLTIATNDDGTATMTLELPSSEAGSPFGLGAQGPITLQGTYNEDRLDVDARGDELFGDMVAVILRSGKFQADATIADVVDISALSVTGTFAADGMAGTYSIAFPGGSGAEGTVTLTR